MASRKDYYDILGIRRDATDEEIEKAYRKLSRTYQFDLYPGNKTAESRLKEIFEAYEILSNKEKRSRYDRSGNEWIFSDPIWGKGSEEEGWDEEEVGRWEGFEDVFEHYFRAPQEMTSRPPQKGKDLHCSIEIDFHQTIPGGIVEIQVERETSCPRCQGKGVNPEGPQKVCEPCGGAGQIQIGLLPVTFSRRCSRCEGRGKIRTQRCNLCTGKGWVAQKEAVFLKIPSGVNNGCRIYRKGMGHASRQGGSAGDLVVQVKVRPHPYFKRKGSDLYIQVPVAAWEAALGGEIEIPTLDGCEKMRIPSGVGNGEELRLQGKGFPLLNGGSRGDQVIVIRIVLPPNLDKRSKEILTELKNMNPQDPRSGLGWPSKSGDEKTLGGSLGDDERA